MKPQYLRYHNYRTVTLRAVRLPFSAPRSCFFDSFEQLLQPELGSPMLLPAAVAASRCHYIVVATAMIHAEG